MKSETSFFSRGIFINTLKNFGWVGVVYFLIQLFCVPLEILLNTGRSEDIAHFAVKRVLLEPDLQRLATIVVPVLLSLLIFRYLQVSNQAVMIHSLPVTRKTLLRSNVLAGILLLVVPTLLTTSVVVVLRASLGLGEVITWSHIGTWLLITLTGDLIMFLATTTVGMVVGMSTAQGALTYIMLFLPVGLTMLILYNLEFFLFGFYRNYATEQFMQAFSPLITILEMNYEVVSFKLIMVYWLVALVLYLFAQVLYKQREIEVASQTLGFASLKPLFKYGVTFCCMLVGGLYFKGRQDSDLWVYFGYGAGSLLGYIAAEMLLNKTIRVLGSWKGYLRYGVIMALVFVGISIDITGYQQKIPQPEQIESVFFGPAYFQMETEQKDMETFKKRGNVEAVRALHQQLIEDKGNWRGAIDQRSPYEYIAQMMLVYQLKDGSELVRSYQVPEVIYAKYLKPLHESPEYKYKHFASLRVKAEQIDKVVFDGGMLGKKVSIVKPEEINEVVALLQADVAEATYEEIQKNSVPWGNIVLYKTDGKLVEESWAKQYRQVEAWLKAKGYLAEARIMPEDIGYVVVEKVDPNMPNTIETKDPNAVAAGKRVELKDQQQIAFFLEHARQHQGKPGYVVGFYAKDKSHLFMAALDEADVPQYVRKQLEK